MAESVAGGEWREIVAYKSSRARTMRDRGGHSITERRGAFLHNMFEGFARTTGPSCKHSTLSMDYVVVGRTVPVRGNR